MPAWQADAKRDARTVPWTPPDDVRHDDVRIRLNDENELFIRLNSSGGGLAAFCVSQRIVVAGKWAEAVRVDCAHGTVHVHYLRRDGSEIRRRELRQITGFADVAKGYDEAIAKILENWEDVARRF